VEDAAFTNGFQLALANHRGQTAEMVLAPGATEGGPNNRHQGSGLWLHVIDGNGRAIVNRRQSALRPRTLLPIERGSAREFRNSGAKPLCTLMMNQFSLTIEAFPSIPTAR